MAVTRVLVASKNKIKGLAAEDAFRIFLNDALEIHLSTKEIDSGVPNQPISLEQSAEGSLNRLQAITGEPGYDYYVAIEGGMFKVETPDGTKWFEAACAAVGANNKRCIAYGPGYPVPERFAAHIVNGKDLNEAMEYEIGVKEIGSSGGFNGWLTEENLDRQKGSAQAVILALYGLRHV
jgi:inosine/xanthosine triphosphatase